MSIVLIAGEIKGRKSPVATASPTIYLDLNFAPEGKFILLCEYTERAIYTVTAGICIDGEELAQHRLVILAEGKPVEISASTKSSCMIIGGEPLGERYKWWNFVSSSTERIELAKQDWQAKKFSQVPEEIEFIPLPQEPDPELGK